MTEGVGVMVEACVFLKAAGRGPGMSRQAREAKEIWATEEVAFKGITRKRATMSSRVSACNYGRVYDRDRHG